MLAEGTGLLSGYSSFASIADGGKFRGCEHISVAISQVLQQPNLGGEYSATGTTKPFTAMGLHFVLVPVVPPLEKMICLRATFESADIGTQVLNDVSPAHTGSAVNIHEDETCTSRTPKHMDFYSGELMTVGAFKWSAVEGTIAVRGRRHAELYVVFFCC